MEFVDTHCHPQFDAFSKDPGRVIKDAAAAGVTRLIMVGTTMEDSRKALDLATKHENTWAAVGVHPHAAREFLDFDDAGLQLRAILKRPKVVAVGEVGLDLYRTYSTRQEQETVLRSQIDETLSSGLPYIFHVRDAWEIFWRVFDSYSALTGVVHSFSTTPKHLEEVLERGLYVGLNGIMTFTKDSRQLDAAKRVPQDRLLLETDAPFLAPKPFRGQTCEPKHVVNVAEFLADLRGESLGELAKATTKNAVNLFKLAESDD
jgi:TatD DNase family protein